MKPFFRSVKNLIRSIGAILSTPPAQRPPHCGNIDSLLLHLCDFDHKLHKWVLQWIAYPLRHPGAKMATCLLVNGGQGTGKNLFFEGVVTKLYGDTARVLPGSELFGSFNPWADCARFVVIDGTYSRSATAQLKAQITSSRVYIKEKFKQARMVPNQMNFVFLTGELDFLPSGSEDRRFMVLEAPPAQPRRFYQAVTNEIENGGIDAFRDFLMFGLDMEGFDENTLPPAAPQYRREREAA